MLDIKTELILMKIKREEEERKNRKYIDMDELHKKKVEYHQTHPDIKPDSLVGGWILYIIVMIGGMIFVDYISLAIFATIFFFSWRHNQIERANGRKYDD